MLSTYLRSVKGFVFAGHGTCVCVIRANKRRFELYLESVRVDDLVEPLADDILIKPSTEPLLLAKLPWSLLAILPLWLTKLALWLTILPLLALLTKLPLLLAILRLSILSLALLTLLAILRLARLPVLTLSRLTILTRSLLAKLSLLTRWLELALALLSVLALTLLSKLALALLPKLTRLTLQNVWSYERTINWQELIEFAHQLGQKGCEPLSFRVEHYIEYELILSRSSTDFLIEVEWLTWPWGGAPYWPWDPWKGGAEGCAPPAYIPKIHWMGEQCISLYAISRMAFLRVEAWRKNFDLESYRKGCHVTFVWNQAPLNYAMQVSWYVRKLFFWLGFY